MCGLFDTLCEDYRVEGFQRQRFSVTLKKKM